MKEEKETKHVKCKNYVSNHNKKKGIHTSVIYSNDSGNNSVNGTNDILWPKWLLKKLLRSNIAHQIWNGASAKIQQKASATSFTSGGTSAAWFN